MTFEQAFQKVIGHEGVFGDDTRDRGNWTSGIIGQGELKGTKYGIAAHAYPTLDIRNLTLDDARAIYKRDFWDKVRADELPESLRAPMFDFAVNSGSGAAIRLLQRSAGVREDGVLGPITLRAVAEMPSGRVLARLQGHRLELLAGLSSWPAFGRGWARRVADYLKEA